MEASRRVSTQAVWKGSAGKVALLTVLIWAPILGRPADVGARPPVSPSRGAMILYEEGKPKQARALVRAVIRNCRFAARRFLDRKPPALQEIAPIPKIIIDMTIKAVDWELKIAGAGKVPPEALALLETARSTLVGIYDELSKRETLDADGKYVVDKYAYELSRVVSKEISLLKKADMTAKAEALQRKYAVILKAGRPKLVPDTPYFIKTAHANPGPLQAVEACYVHDMPEAGRVRLLALLIRMRRDVAERIKAGKLDANTVSVPETMARYVFNGTDSEAAKLEKLAVLRMTIEIIEDVNAQILRSLSEKQKEEFKANLARSQDWLGRLRNHEQRWRGRCKEWATARGETTRPRSGPGVFRNVNWGRAKVSLSGRDFRVVGMINVFYEALAAGDAKRMKEVLAAGPEYATAEGIMARVEQAKQAGEFDRILGYDVVDSTQYRIVAAGGLSKVLVTSLRVRMIVKGREVVGTKSGMFDIIMTKDGLRLGFPKLDVRRSSRSERSSTQPSSSPGRTGAGEAGTARD